MRNFTASLIIGIGSVLFSAPHVCGAIIRVDDTATTPGPGDLSDWSNAFNNLQAALDLARTNGEADEIRVARSSGSRVQMSTPIEANIKPLRFVCGA